MHAHWFISSVHDGENHSYVGYGPCYPTLRLDPRGTLSRPKCVINDAIQAVSLDSDEKNWMELRDTPISNTETVKQSH